MDATTAASWTIEEPKPGDGEDASVHVIRCHGSDRPDWEQWVLLMADEHWDSPDCNWEMLREHHEEAKRFNAPIIKAGDMFCAMQGKYDKRADKTKLRDIHQTGNYLDSLPDTAAEWYAPYRDQIAVVAKGNHETAIQRIHETDLLARFVDKLGGNAHLGGYSGWIKFHASSSKDGGGTATVNLWYMHGHGGAAAVTKGMIDWNRYATWVENYDVMLAGHVHHKQIDIGTRIWLTERNKVRKKPVYHVRCGAYKDEYKGGRGGYHKEKGRSPRPIGGWWMRLSWHKKKAGEGRQIKVDFQEAH